MKTNYSLLTFTLVVCLFLPLVYPAKAQTVLDIYVKEGLQHNLVLQQKSVGIEKALLALKEANAAFLPTVAINSSYITGQGGRYFDFPLGDMLNPVYQTLNQLTDSKDFSQVSNVEAYLNPSNFYDAHVRTSLPIVNSNLHYNRDIQKQRIELQEHEVNTYKRELTKDIKLAYYNYLTALAGIDVYQSTLNLVNKNLAVNESLVKNGKGLPANLIRARSEVEKVNAALTTAQTQVKNAQHYFNFLLNKPLDADIDTSYQLAEAVAIVPDTPDLTGVEKREELLALRRGRQIQETVCEMNRQFWVPQVSGFLDVGTQTQDWKFNNKARYYLGGVQLDIPVFTGNRNKYRIQQSDLDLKQITLQENQVTQQLQLAITVAQNNISAAQREYQSALVQLKAAESYYRLIEVGFREGIYSLIEFIDARNQLTSAQLQKNMQTYKVLQNAATLERETAAYVISN
ncbi:TolC family protein [Adhaeribacter arboris]|uniref:TolC family protein n=1 Tax=Adhaeribacter arboris TaxID=2072846 RepID=A0A2T2YHV2_9BACT|nr:TolC family protein [Adhaeribacter arboris]PSR55084.1 TolC family protein [Adhaeribacter arboris]